MVGTSFLVGILFTDLTYREKFPDIMNSTKILNFIEPLDRVIVEKTSSIQKNRLYEVVSDIEKYPLILPKNILDVKIINKTNNYIISEMIVSEGGFQSTIKSKHTFEPDHSYTIEIIEGDAKGTTIIQTFEDSKTIPNHTTWTVDTKLKLTGIFTPIKYMPVGNIRHSIFTVIDKFSIYATSFDTEQEKMIDDLYREILLRPADKEGLDYYSKQIVSGKMGIAQIRVQLENSDEKKHMILPTDLKTIDELLPETKKIINDLYEEILFRPADPSGLQNYGSMLENGKMTIKEIKRILIESDEKKQLNK